MQSGTKRALLRVRHLMGGLWSRCTIWDMSNLGLSLYYHAWAIAAGSPSSVNSHVGQASYQKLRCRAFSDFGEETGFLDDSLLLIFVAML